MSAGDGNFFGGDNMEEIKIYGYMRVSSREQNEDRQRISLCEAGVPKHNIYMDKLSSKNFEKNNMSYSKYGNVN